MEIWTHVKHFSALDGIAVGLLIIGWLVLSWQIERPGTRTPSVTVLMERYRREWFAQVITRENRIFDSNIMSNMRAGTTFFASACMISIGGAITLIGNSERLIGVAQDLTLDAGPQIVWELKLILVLFFVTNGFFKFVWAHRLFGYCSVVMASIPNDPDDPLAQIRANQAADINITGSRSFTRGMRSVYFALSALAWLAGAEALIAAAVFTVSVLIRREFASQSRVILLKDHSKTGNT